MFNIFFANPHKIKVNNKEEEPNLKNSLNL